MMLRGARCVESGCGFLRIYVYIGYVVLSSLVQYTLLISVHVGSACRMVGGTICIAMAFRAHHIRPVSSEVFTS